MARTTELRARIMAKVTVDPVSGCWIHGGTPSHTHSYIGVEGRKVYVHRAMYELDVGPIPEGLVLDHVAARGCISTKCCNPAHLEPVTQRENVRRGSSLLAQRARQTHCKHGHLLDEANIYRRPDRPTRECRACRSRQVAEWCAANR